METEVNSLSTMANNLLRRLTEDFTLIEQVMTEKVLHRCRVNQ